MSWPWLNSEGRVDPVFIVDLVDELTTVAAHVVQDVAVLAVFHQQQQLSCWRGGKCRAAYLNFFFFCGPWVGVRDSWALLLVLVQNQQPLSNSTVSF